MFSVTNNPNLKASLYTDFLQVNNSFDVCPIVVKIISLWVNIVFISTAKIPNTSENVIDLESEVNQLTETEKMAICQHHCKCKGVNQNIYASLSFTKANHMFPFLCKIFSQDEKYQQLGESFFNKPYKYFNNELGKL
jgi:hypothetical protein